MTGCGCHDVAVFGHQEGCALRLGPPPAPGHDWKAVMRDRALNETLSVMAARDKRTMATVPRSKYAVMGGWLKKRG